MSSDLNIIFKVSLLFVLLFSNPEDRYNVSPWFFVSVVFTFNVFISLNCAFPFNVFSYYLFSQILCYFLVPGVNYHLCSIS